MVRITARQLIKEEVSNAPNPDQYLQDLKQWVHEQISIHSDQPVDMVRWVSADKVQANNYNPNSVAKNEMSLLYLSIKNDGYTQPIVTIYDADLDKYIIVDGFHRHLTLKTYKDIYDKNHGMLPVVVIKKDINDRMASTVRHNRARGKHSVDGMASMVFNMLDNGWADDAICKELGMEADELLRLKHITGFSKLFENVEYSRSWEVKRQIKAKKAYEESLKGNESGK